MSIAVNFTPEEAMLLENQAGEDNTTVEDFIRNASLKSARNARYLAKLDRSIKQFEEGKFIKKTTEELERMIHG